MKIIDNEGKTGALVLKVEEEDINTIFLNTDLTEDGTLQYSYDNFADVFSENILEYAFAYAHIPREEITRKQREAARSLMKLKNVSQLREYFEQNVPESEWDKDFLKWYRGRGVFGEIILHMILKEFKNTIPLVSKMYFKDSFAQEAKGFDAVHVSRDGSTLWLGETKFYTSWKTKGKATGGIEELVKDLKSHFNKDYFSEQFVVIKRGLDSQYEHPLRKEWLEKLNKPVVLKDVFQYIRIPMLCIYEDKIADKYIANIEATIKNAEIEQHTMTVKEYYDSLNDAPLREKMQTVLILLPIEAKNTLIKYMLEKVWHMQNI